MGEIKLKLRIKKARSVDQILANFQVYDTDNLWVIIWTTKKDVYILQINQKKAPMFEILLCREKFRW